MIFCSFLQVVDCTVFTDEDNSHAVSAVQKYSRLSQQFENLLICSLILLDKNSQMSIDKLPDTMQPIKDLHQTLVSSLEHTLLPVNSKFIETLLIMIIFFSCLDCLDSVMDDIKRLSDEDALNCEDAANHLNCTIDRAEIQTKTYVYKNHFTYKIIILEIPIVALKRCISLLWQLIIIGSLILP